MLTTLLSRALNPFHVQLELHFNEVSRWDNLSGWEVSGTNRLRRPVKLRLILVLGQFERLELGVPMDESSNMAQVQMQIIIVPGPAAEAGATEAAAEEAARGGGLGGSLEEAACGGGLRGVGRLGGVGGEHGQQVGRLAGPHTRSRASLADDTLSK